MCCDNPMQYTPVDFSRPWFMILLWRRQPLMLKVALRVWFIIPSETPISLMYFTPCAFSYNDLWMTYINICISANMRVLVKRSSEAQMCNYEIEVSLWFCFPPSCGYAEMQKNIYLCSVSINSVNHFLNDYRISYTVRYIHIHSLFILVFCDLKLQIHF